MGLIARDFSEASLPRKQSHYYPLLLRTAVDLVCLLISDCELEERADEIIYFVQDTTTRVNSFGRSTYYLVAFKLDRWGVGSVFISSCM